MTGKIQKIGSNFILTMGDIECYFKGGSASTRTVRRGFWSFDTSNLENNFSAIVGYVTIGTGAVSFNGFPSFSIGIYAWNNEDDDMGSSLDVGDFTKIVDYGQLIGQLDTPLPNTDYYVYITSAPPFSLNSMTDFCVVPMTTSFTTSWFYSVQIIGLSLYVEFIRKAPSLAYTFGG
jgi:hypothetical protein